MLGHLKDATKEEYLASRKQHCPFFFFFFSFLRLHPWHMEIPRLGVESELQLLVYSTATATSNPSLVCNITAQGRRILNPWARPEIKPTISWFLVGFVSALPQRELPTLPFKSLYLYLEADVNFVPCTQENTLWASLYLTHAQGFIHILLSSLFIFSEFS